MQSLLNLSPLLNHHRHCLCPGSHTVYTVSLFSKWSLQVQHRIQFRSVTQSCPALCDPMDCSMPGLPVHQQLPEFTQTHVHWVSDAIQPSHSLSSPSPSTFNFSQHQGLLKWVSSSHQVAKVLEFQLQASVLPTNIQEWFPLGLDLLGVQGTLKSLLQHHSSKASIFRCSAFFIVQLSHPSKIAFGCV